jgi:hypothetical protein
MGKILVLSSDDSSCVDDATEALMVGFGILAMTLGVVVLMGIFKIYPQTGYVGLLTQYG